MYERMALIRAFEDTTQRQFADGQIPGFVHLYAGEEAVAVGVCTHLTDADFITSTHRGHGHCIAKGVDVGRDGGRADGQARRASARARAARCTSPTSSKGMLGANGIVGGGYPARLRRGADGEDAADAAPSRVCFFGDGASNQGTFHESLNLAAIWQLPVVFVCENNGYAEADDVQLPLLDRRRREPRAGLQHPRRRRRRPRRRSPCSRSPARRSRARAAATARRLIEAKTYRFYGHEEGDTATYRTAEEVEAFRRATR